MPTLDPTDVGQPSKPAKTTTTKKTATKTVTSGSTQGGYTARTWAIALLQRLGVQTTRANVRAIVSWEAAEGGHWENTARYNPLNTTQDAPGATSMNSVGVKVYTSWEQGLDATAQTLRNGYYANVLGALQAGNNPRAVLQAVTASPWSSYPNGITLVGSTKAYGTGAGTSGGGGTVIGADNSGGAATGGGGDMGSSKPLTVRQYLDDPYIAQNYGYLSAYLHDPEVGPILAKAARNGWGANQLLGALSKTKWWQHTSATARAWQAQQRVDPATANQRLHQMSQQIQTLAQSTLGYKLDPQRVSTIANTAIASDWSSQQLQHAIGAEFHYHQAQHALQGAAGQTVDQFKQMSSQYLVPLSNHTLNRWTRGVLEGVYQPADFESYLKAQAASLYPTLKSALDQGHTVQDFLNPYAELAAQTLNMNPESIDWFHPKWSKALNTTTPDGQRAPMSLSDWSTYLRGLPEYKHTPEAQAQAASLALNLATTFGKVSV